MESPQKLLEALNSQGLLDTVLTELGGPAGFAKEIASQINNPLILKALMEIYLKTGQALPTISSVEKKDLSDFSTFCQEVGYPKPYPAQIEMFEYMFTDGIDVLMGARGYGKSDVAVICGLAYYIYHNRKATFLLLTKEKYRASELTGSIIGCLEKVGIEFKNKAVTAARVLENEGKEPTIKALGISGALRGNHPDFVICDDIVSKDDLTAKERNKVLKVWDTEILNLTPNIKVIGQPVHHLDLYAKLKNSKNIRYHEWKHGSIPELDADLDLKRASGMTERALQSNYFLNVDVDNDILPIGRITEEPIATTGQQAAGYVDPSFTGGDYTAVAIASPHFEKMLISGFCFKRSWDDSIELIEELSRAYNVSKWGFETNSLGKAPLAIMRAHGLAVSPVNHTENKHARIINVSPYCESLVLSNLIPPELSNPIFREAQMIFNEQCRTYEYGAEHDDAPDALSGVLEFLGLIGRVKK